MTEYEPIDGDSLTDAQQCDAQLNIKGEGFRCDLRKNHQGWPHSSTAAGAIWSGSSVAHAQALPDGIQNTPDCARIARGEQ